MNNHLSGWGLTTLFDRFLFASVCEDRNGLPLSVLSALVRINCDPWKEAARLAAMPKAKAEISLVSSLHLAAANGWDPAQANMISAHLVSLLPQPDVSGTATLDPRKANVQFAIYLLVWFGLVMTISLLSASYPATTKDTSAATTASTASISVKNSTSGRVDIGGHEQA